MLNLRLLFQCGIIFVLCSQWNGVKSDSIEGFVMFLASFLGKF